MKGHDHRSPHADFDGHLERPYESLSPAERLWWLDEVMRFAAAARPVVPGGMGVLREVVCRVDAGTGRPAQPPRFDGLGVVECELRLTIDDRHLFMAWTQPDDDWIVGVSRESHFPAQELLRDVDVSATPGWSDLIGQFVVLRYLTPDRARLGIETSRDRPVVIIEADDFSIEARRTEA